MDQAYTQNSHTKAGRAAGICCFMDLVAGEAEEYASNHSTPMSPILEEIEDYTLTKTPYASMLTGRVEGRFLQLIAQLSGARNIVDIGTFTGYSALAMAEVIPDDGEVLTIEHNPDFAKIAQEFFNRSPGGHKVKLLVGEAPKILKALPDAGTDIVFIDADKQNYGLYYREAMRILREGGFVLADNALWYGRIFNPRDDDSWAVAQFNEMVKSDVRAEKLFLTIRDGIYVIRKLPGPGNGKQLT